MKMTLNQFEHSARVSMDRALMARDPLVILNKKRTGFFAKYFAVSPDEPDMWEDNQSDAGVQAIDQFLNNNTQHA